MKTFIADIIPRIQRFSKKLDDLTKLTNQNWVSIDDIRSAKRVFIFEKNGELDIYENGLEVDSGSWKLVNQSLKLRLNSGGYLLKHGFFDENVIALKLDSTNSYVFFVNETKYNRELNNINDVIRFLSDKYLSNDRVDGGIGQQRKQTLSSSKLPAPNFYVEQMLRSDTETVINTTINWKQFCDSHSKYYPLYTYQELLKRGIVIPERLKSALDDYAECEGFISFERMKDDYFD